ncbi:MAG: hypothetical protein HY423_11995 [Candidatus Lambdaproteobacteria bacterium]|nr:hypothetical protein [Candidatus Lambdaproteobacteria bacterium]
MRRSRALRAALCAVFALATVGTLRPDPQAATRSFGISLTVQSILRVELTDAQDTFRMETVTGAGDTSPQTMLVSAMSFPDDLVAPPSVAFGTAGVIARGPDNGEVTLKTFVRIEQVDGKPKVYVGVYLPPNFSGTVGLYRGQALVNVLFL